MAMIQCPECGQEISDKAKKCINCGKVLIEEGVPTKFCSECGKEISVDVKECPFCGFPVEQEADPSNTAAKIMDKAAKNKKPLLIVAGIAAVCVIVVLIFNLIGSTLNEDEQLAYQNAVEMQSMMRDPDSFKLYDEMFLLKHHDENGELDYTYTIFKYGGANGYGAITTSEAIFKDGRYIMDYADELDAANDDNYEEKFSVRWDVLNYGLTGDNDEWEKVDIDIEKIKDKMGLE